MPRPSARSSARSPRSRSAIGARPQGRAGRRLRRLRPPTSIRSPPRCRSRARGAVRPDPGAVRRDAPSAKAASSGAISTPTRSRGWPTRRSSRPISPFRVVKNGAGSVNPALRRLRPLSPTRSSPRRESASARCRFEERRARRVGARTPPGRLRRRFVAERHTEPCG